MSACVCVCDPETSTLMRPSPISAVKKIPVMIFGRVNACNWFRCAITQY